MAASFSLKDNWLTRYVLASRDELKKVTWPSREQVIRDTLVVAVVSLAMGVFFGVVDFGLTKGLQEIIAR
jgi:preprotein translocase subunit SecE